MIIDDGIKFVTSHISLLASTSYSIIANPFTGYACSGLIDNDVQKSEVENFWAYLVVCIFLGSTVISFIPGQDKSYILDNGEFIFTLIITLWLWLLFSIYAFIVTKTLRGTANFIQTTKLSMVLLATAYSLSALVSYTSAVLMKILLNNEYRIEMPHTVYVITQAIFLLVYLPANLGKINNFGAFRKTIISLILPLSVIVTNLALMVFFIGKLNFHHFMMK